MNERIQELIKESTTIEYGMDKGFDRVNFDKEKFAHLLIEKFAYSLMDLHGSSPEHIVHAAKMYGVNL